MHAELVTAAPFAACNGIVARAAERLVLVARGVDPASLVVPEAGHLALRAAYESNLRGYRDGGRAGLHAWLLYAAEAQAAGAEASPLRALRTAARPTQVSGTGRHPGDRERLDAARHTVPATRRALSNCGPRTDPGVTNAL